MVAIDVEGAGQRFVEACLHFSEVGFSVNVPQVLEKMGEDDRLP